MTAISFAREYNVAVTVIYALFRKHGLSCRTAAREVRFTPEHRINRIAFCEVLLEQWDDDKLESIIFSDEKTFCTDVSWRSKVWRSYNTRYDPQYVKVDDKSGRITNNYWGAIGIDGPLTPIVRIEGHFNAAKYINILRNHVVPIMDSFVNENDPRIFMQDNSPVHTADSVMAFISRQNFELMEWPPKSPDLNPIENVWSKMTYAWPQIHPRNEENLDAAVKERWNALNDDQRKHWCRKSDRIIKALQLNF